MEEKEGDSKQRGRKSPMKRRRGERERRGEGKGKR
jgi:hypothetical protein